MCITRQRQQAALTGRRSRIHHVTDYGADPTGRSDSTDALEQAIVDAFTSPVDGHLNEGVPNLGGSEVHLDGGTYMISRPLRLSDISGGNFMVRSNTRLPHTSTYRLYIPN